MVAIFIETPRFPINISYGSGGGPEFKTSVFTGHSGTEQRNVARERSKGSWDVSQGIRDKADMDSLREFFYACRGRAVGFRFRDWGDYQLVQEAIGTADALETEFTLIKTYAAGAQTYVRRILKPVPITLDADAPFTVRVDGVTVDPADYTVDYTDGTVVFDSAPASGSIDITCEFDVPARFDTDKLNAKHDSWLQESWDSIPIIELLQEDFE